MCAGEWDATDTDYADGVPEAVPFDTRYAVIGSASLPEAYAYCRRLARSHYENFLVGTVFIPRHLRQHFYAIYAYCRIADDLADESPTPERALQLLDWWEGELKRACEGRPKHPVFVALAETMATFGIPSTPFTDLLVAFRQDQTVRRYDTYAQLLDYCRYSANPVGRLVLHLFGFTDDHRRTLSDATCTALQLANFWQDVARDCERGRIYLPREDMKRFGVLEDQIQRREFTPEFGRLLEFECSRARELFEYGSALADVVPRRLRLDVEMFTQGGLEVLRRIEKQGYDVLSRRPAIPKSRQAAILLRRVFGMWRR
jgi:squalene synthase HpnC